MKMPITRKLIQIGNAKGITLPKSWIELQEQKAGKPLKILLLEVNNVLKVSADNGKEVSQS